MPRAAADFCKKVCWWSALPVTDRGFPSSEREGSVESRRSHLGSTALLTGEVKAGVVPPQTTETVTWECAGFAFGTEKLELSWNTGAFSSSILQ